MLCYVHQFSGENTLKLYHGTNYSSAINICTNGIALEYSQPFLDFGAGFYTTPSYEHAAITAIRKTDKFNAKNKSQEEPCVVELKYFPLNDGTLKIISYSGFSKQWGQFVLSNRLTPDILKKYTILEHNQDSRYDICIGGIADGTIINVAYQVNHGLLLPGNVYLKDFLKKQGRAYPIQYSFHTEAAISCISGLSYDIIRNKEIYLNQMGKKGR